MNSFVKTKDKSQKKRRRIDASRSLRNQRRQQEEEEDKSTVVGYHKKRSIGSSLCYLCIHARVIIDYYYIRDRVCYRIQTCALLFPLCATRLEIRLQNLFDFLRDRFWFTHGAYTRVATRECFFDRV